MNNASDHTAPQTAFIREQECIGCTKCFAACPVDAIVGAPRFLHTVLASTCTGCALCLSPCPVDCIELRPATQQPDPSQSAQAAQRKIQRLAKYQNSSDVCQASLQPKAPINPSKALERQKLKTAVNMTQIALTKAEQQYQRHATPVLAAQICKLTQAADIARKRLTDWERHQQNPASTPASTQTHHDALHQAKVVLVQQKAALKNAQQENVTEEALTPLRHAIEQATQKLHQAEAETQRPTPSRQRLCNPSITTQFRDLKTERALALAALQKQNRHLERFSQEEQQQAQERLQQAEQQLAEYLAAHPTDFSEGTDS